MTHLSMPISERPAERGERRKREREREEHIFGFILETESHIIPRRLRIPYHPLQKKKLADTPVKTGRPKWNEAAFQSEKAGPEILR